MAPPAALAELSELKEALDAANARAQAAEERASAAENKVAQLESKMVANPMEKLRQDLVARIEAFTSAHADVFNNLTAQMDVMYDTLLKHSKIEIGPIRAEPLLRKKRQAMAFALVFMQPVLSAILSIVLLFWCGMRIRIAFLMYVAWFHFIDKAPKQGGRLSQCARKSPVWRWVSDYFPVSLVKTTELDPNKNYLFGYHPHGIISVGAITNFASDATGFSKLFPGIALRVATLTFNFQIPFFREFLLHHGVVDASASSISYSLSRCGPGGSCMVIIGGAKESLNARPGTNRLVLAERKGFVKVALRTGASLVPVYSFGENELFDQARGGGLVQKIQTSIQHATGFTVPLFFGPNKGQSGSFAIPGMLPRRHAIVSVVGSPVHVPEPIPEPTQEQVDHYHALYMEALRAIWDDNKDKLAAKRKEELIIQ